MYGKTFRQQKYFVGKKFREKNRHFLPTKFFPIRYIKTFQILIKRKAFDFLEYSSPSPKNNMRVKLWRIWWILVKFSTIKAAFKENIIYDRFMKINTCIFTIFIAPFVIDPSKINNHPSHPLSEQSLFNSPLWMMSLKLNLRRRAFYLLDVDEGSKKAEMTCVVGCLKLTEKFSREKFLWIWHILDAFTKVYQAKNLKSFMKVYFKEFLKFFNSWFHSTFMR